MSGIFGFTLNRGDPRCRLSDEELLLKLVREKGFKALQMVNGDFAGAVFDREKGCWTLFRDHLGVRPLYYYLDDEAFVFSTELRGIAAVPGIGLRPNEKRLFASVHFCNTLSLVVRLLPHEDACTIRPLEGMTKVDQLMRNTYRPELIEQHRLQQHFQRCVNLAMKLPMAAVTRVDREDCAGRMYDLITDHATGLYQNGVKG